MLRTGENETEILLGNKQLLGVFFVIAILLGAAFTGGYMVGRNGSAKRAATEDPAASSPARNPSAIETHSIPGDAVSSDSSAGRDTDSTKAGRQKSARGSEAGSAPPLGSRRSTSAKAAPKESASEPEPSPEEEFNPHSGQQFLQVAAVGRDEAEAIADVLHKKGFRAHAVPKPGSPKIYRVLIGPIRDTGDLSNTRDSLRRTGFREVIVQRY
jgi:cell division septation protein DedD